MQCLAAPQTRRVLEQSFLGVNKGLDFAPHGFFFAEKDGEPIGISAGIVLHDRKRIGRTFPAASVGQGSMKTTGGSDSAEL